VSLVSQYDSFLAKLLRQIFLSKHALLNCSEKTLTLSQLLEFDSIAEARESILEKEVESVLRKSHSEQFQWMENRFDTPLRKGLGAWPNFIELTERRNLFVHSGGIVSSQYLKVCQEHGVVFKNEPKIGDALDVEPRYFKGAVDTVFEIGVKLAQVLWRKFQPDKIEQADSNLIDIGYDPLSEGNYKLAKILFDFAAVTLKKHSSDEYRRVFIVNRALAYKWNGEEKEAREIVEAEDWSATRPRFRLAEAVILDRCAEALAIMRQIGKDTEELPKYAYKDWPLFKEFREKPEFLQVYQDIFEEPLSRLTVDESSSLAGKNLSSEFEPKAIPEKSDSNRSIPEERKPNEDTKIEGADS
jgi:hypothetical protein